MKKLRKLFRRKVVIVEYNPTRTSPELLIASGNLTRTNVTFVPSPYEGPNREAFRIVKL